VVLLLLVVVPVGPLGPLLLVEAVEVWWAS
jgi:hypothetical protein